MGLCDVFFMAPQIPPVRPAPDVAVEQAAALYHSLWLAAPITAVVYFGPFSLVGGVDLTEINRVTDGSKNTLARTHAD